MTVWMLAEKLLSNSTGDPDVELRSWLLSFFKIPTIHERYGDGSSRATIVHTIARQEQDAAVEGVSTIDWITIILSERGPGAGLSVRGMSRGKLLATLVHGPLRSATGGAGLRRRCHLAAHEEELQAS